MAPIWGPTVVQAWAIPSANSSLMLPASDCRINVHGGPWCALVRRWGLRCVVAGAPLGPPPPRPTTGAQPCVHPLWDRTSLPPPNDMPLAAALAKFEVLWRRTAAGASPGGGGGGGGEQGMVG